MFEFDKPTTDQDRLIAFVQAVEKLLSKTIASGHWELTDPPLTTNLSLEPELLAAARAALEELKQQQHVSNLVGAIDRASETTLQSHGIDGDQLRFKLETVKHRERRFRLFPRFRPLKRLIDAIDTLLESIADALGVGGAIKELKDTLMGATKDPDERI